MTSALSELRSSQLSYTPLFFKGSGFCRVITNVSSDALCISWGAEQSRRGCTVSSDEAMIVAQ